MTNQTKRGPRPDHVREKISRSMKARAPEISARVRKYWASDEAHAVGPRSEATRTKISQSMKARGPEISARVREYWIARRLARVNASTLAACPRCGYLDRQQ